MVDTYEELIPDPSRIIEGLRDTGYQFETAIADIVDNSIAADSSRIDINIIREFDGKIIVNIIDNGIGMTQAELKNAMRYGSKTRQSRYSLGKFGLGLKTASTAFCRRLSVISKSGKSDYNKASWDLDHVSSVGKWELQKSTPSQDEIKILEEVADNGHGTLVMWEKVDRFLNKTYSNPGSATRAYTRAINNLKDYLPMIYQRFLDPEDSRAPTIELYLNKEKINHWNPFYPDISEVVGEQTVEVDIGTDEEVTTSFTIKAYVLKRSEEFQKLESEARIENKYQGIYVYRENRMIYGPAWFNLWQNEDHYKLLRVEFSFNQDLDAAFHIDIKKSQVILDEVIIDFLKKFMLAPRRAANEVYRDGLKLGVSKLSQSIHSSSNKSIAAKAKQVSESSVEVVDEEKEQVRVDNKFGPSRLKIKLSDPKEPNEIHVKAVQDLESGLLWEPTVMLNNVGVLINTSHKYYEKVYVPNRNKSVIIQGLDSLLWALSEAEMETINEQNQRYFIEMRFAVSKILRTLIDHLPDPEVDN